MAPGTRITRDACGGDPLAAVAAAIVQDGRLLVVSKPAAELAHLRWISGHERDVQLPPAVRDHVLPLLRQGGLMAS
ncbi:hypothetical protein [Nonomuraea diastatica]|uniref:hypothetical protein n=1 Tax=Nonomuraea diastatica TaxID=1848329 RepID=UPI001C708A8E|nr:hypothetical protein [Nonomuraea diastatica]